AGKDDVDIAVRAAKKAFKSWKTVSPYDRSRYMSRLADLIERDAQLLSEMESLFNGKPVAVALAVDIDKVIRCIRYYAGWADKVHGKVVDHAEGMFTYTKREPIGVVGQIIPWNFPLLMLAWKWGPALATGNTIVMKTSEKTPLSALHICKLVVEAGFPPGVINVLSGFGPTCGAYIASHMDIGKVAFTGSTATGRAIMEAVAKSNLKKVSLELGGKSPNIIFADANLDEAVSAASTGIFFNHGQVCCAGSRIYVQEDIYDAFLAKFTAAAKQIKVGDPLDQTTQHGPLVDQTQFNKVLGYIETGKKEGASVVCGGERIGSKGFFFPPTVLAGVQDHHTVAKEEIFGPVAAVMKFKTFDEVVERANKSQFGLAAAVHTTSLSTALKMADALEAGTVWVRCTS
ncbi:Mitochondrial 10-formyltetrahydrofolate dehydrogenase, partial [Kappamyces sp. JEL0680]